LVELCGAGFEDRRRSDEGSSLVVLEHKATYNT